MFAEIVFPVAKPLVLTYRVHANLQPIVRPGQRVRVALGKSIRTGIIVSLSKNTYIPNGRLKEILEIESATPLISEELLRVCWWAADYYCCSIGQVIRQFLGDRLKSPKRKRSIPVKAVAYQDKLQIRLTATQTNAMNQIEKYLAGNEHHVVLIHGVTGSGKTIVYIELIRRTLEKGKSVLFLVPEIGLTWPIWKSIASSVNEPIAMIHSNMSKGERFSNWLMIREGRCRIVIGARSAVWAPLDNLGLVVVDEEHDRSFKNEGIPRYHARDVAIYRGSLNSCLVVLGSASPSFESYANTEKGKYHLIELPERFGSARLPDVLVVDMKEEHSTGNWGFFSRILMEKIGIRLADREQIILLLNRRGFAPLLLCKSCGYIARCPHCDVATTYHKTGNRLCCHYCGFVTGAPNQCPKCKGIDIKFQGFGIQRVEKEILEFFPAIRVQRMDADTTRRRNAHEEILDRFAKGDADILIGTQMVAKGLDFPNVTLVGIISADVGLNMPDFRAAENTFQLLSQVAGRAGRGDKRGEVILQTYSPQEACIVCAKNHDYKTFFEIEKKSRKALRYPPVNRLIQIVLSHSNDRILLKSAQELVRLLRRDCRANTIILGPAQAPLAKQSDQYRMLVMLKGASSAELHRQANRVVRYLNPSVHAIVDVDPIFML